MPPPPCCGNQSDQAEALGGGHHFCLSSCGDGGIVEKAGGDVIRVPGWVVSTVLGEAGPAVR